ncbi:MAG: ABC transporter permease subunit [Chloroflexi bacterium]|nr:ABC transporter permease subunit [Chloroflexota bacterium]
MRKAFAGLWKTSGSFRFGIISLVFAVFMVVMSFFSPFKPMESFAVTPDLRPSFTHLFGTNSRGQDLFWQMTFALRNSLMFGVLTAILSRIIAIWVGMYSGYKGGFIDKAMMSVNDSFVIIPVLPILLLLNFLLREKMNWFYMALMMALLGWAYDARLIRSQVMSLKVRIFSDTAVFCGMPTLRIIYKEHLPYVLPIIFATTINNLLWSIGMEVTLSILGLTNINVPTIGVVFFWANQHQALISGVWWWVAVPVVVTVFVFTGLYLLSVSLNEYIDPRTRLRMKGGAV